MEKFTAIVLAGGTGKRMHSHIHKQYLTLAGKPVLYYALKAFEESDITDIILVTGADEEAYCKRKAIMSLFSSCKRSKSTVIGAVSETGFIADSVCPFSVCCVCGAVSTALSISTSFCL